MEETFKDIPGYEGHYQVSNLGNVKSFKLNTENILTPTKMAKGYLCLNLVKNKKVKLFYVHQLVAMAFLNHKAKGHKMVVNHINFIKTDNRVENLEVVTARENSNQKHLPSSSKYVGVNWCKTYKKWYARIRINGKRKNLGGFANEYDAHLAYEKKLKEIQNEELSRSN